MKRTDINIISDNTANRVEYTYILAPPLPPLPLPPPPPSRAPRRQTSIEMSRVSGLVRVSSLHLVCLVYLFIQETVFAN